MYCNFFASGKILRGYKISWCKTTIIGLYVRIDCCRKDLIFPSVLEGVI